MTDPHAAAPDEDPEQHIGETRPDPWDSTDEADADWPNQIIEVHGAETPDAAKGVAHVEEV